MAPMKNFQQRNNYASWLTEETKAVLINRDNAVAKARQTKDPQDWVTANTLRNACTRILRNEKHKSLKNKLEKCEEEQDISSIWKKNIMNKAKAISAELLELNLKINWKKWANKQYETGRNRTT